MTVLILGSEQTKLVTEPFLLPFVELCEVFAAGKLDGANRWMKSIKDDLGKVDRRFQDGQMEDAHEFLCVFLLELSRGLDRLCLTPNLVNTNLKYWFEDTFTCCDCQAREANSHDNISFILDFPNDYSNTSRPASLQSMLTANFAADTREKYCDDCGGAQASVSTKLISLPRALNICVLYSFVIGDISIVNNEI